MTHSFEASFWPNDERPPELGGGGINHINLIGDFEVPGWGQDGSPGWEMVGRGLFDIGVKLPDGKPIIWEHTTSWNPDGTEFTGMYVPQPNILTSHLEVDDSYVRFLLRPFSECQFVIEQMLKLGWLLDDKSKPVYENYREWERTNATLSLDHMVTRSGHVIGHVEDDGSVTPGEVKI